MGLFNWAERPASVLAAGGVIAPDERLPALAEAALSVAIIAAASWDGVRARFRRRPAAL